ncbi:MAG: hypothetical protein QF692_09460 [Alphaproteobacteria bacterium]|jgi:hypothetical protein|nr:hypothetical protein [Alphaproteobacteria bacterium]MDP7223472.1 hypothetical protein [Alphaproteobacteria bacterium]
MISAIKTKHLLNHPPKREGLIKFLLLLCVLLGYTGYLSWEYGFATGGLVAALTWSFFVLCTPVADAGFLLDFPVRLITGLRMFFCELIVWTIAISLNLSVLYFSPQSYENTFLTSLLHKILTTPWPYWSIVILCACGTFLSVKFGDEMMDVIAHKDRKYHHKHGFKHQLIALAALALLIIWAYYHLIAMLGIEIKTP